MQCPSCQSRATRVADSRVTEGGNAVRRRRVCEACEFRFTTFERAQANDLVVGKRDGTTEPYVRAKLEKAILLACAKRPVDMQLMREKLSELEESRWSRHKTITTQQIGEDVMKLLKNIDEVAYVRFASVYREFADIASFQAALKGLG